MTNNQLTDERLVKILSETQATIMEHNSRCVRGSVEVDARLFESMIMELQERRKAERDSEPVAWIVGSDEIDEFNRGREVMVMRDSDDEELESLPLYRRAQPAPERDQVRSEHAEWSHATFGNVGPVGPLKHLSKEALEAAAEPGDPSEWADMQFLLWDAQRRAGITDEQITQAMIEKLAVNKQREWPEPKDGEPRLHIKEQMVPVTQQEPIAWLNDAYLARGVVDGEAGSEDAGPGYIPVYREPATQPAPVVPPMQHWEELCREHPDMSIGDAIIRAAWWNHCRAAMLQAGNSPVIPDGLIAAVNRLLDSDGSRGCYSAIQCGDAHDEIERLLAAAPHDTPALNSVQSVVTVPGKWIPVSERVPENDGAYLCWDKRYVTTYAFIFGAWQANQFISKNITHWMPLPSGPQEVQGE